MTVVATVSTCGPGVASPGGSSEAKDLNRLTPVAGIDAMSAPQAGQDWAFPGIFAWQVWHSTEQTPPTMRTTPATATNLPAEGDSEATSLHLNPALPPN